MIELLVSEITEKKLSKLLLFLFAGSESLKKQKLIDVLKNGC